jgi:hypothetical protein
MIDCFTSLARREWRESRAAILLIVAGGMWLSLPPVARAEFILLDSFNSGTVGGLLSTSNPAWSTVGPFAIAVDPTNAANRVASAVQLNASNNQTAVLPFGTSNVIANGTTGTVFFRMMRGPTANSNFLGYVNSGTTADTGQRRSGIGSNAGASQPMVMRGLSNTDVVTSGFTNLAQDTWYRYWVVMDNAADTFTTYSQREGSSPLPQTLLSNAAGSTQTFIGTTTSSALQSLFFAQTSGNGVNMDFYFDDIYIDPTGSNLAMPPIVVPEPSASLLGCVGLAGLASGGLWRRTRGLRAMRSVSR